MLRFAIRLTFWSCLLVAVLPGAQKGGVYDEKLGFLTVVKAFKATAMDLSTFCSRNNRVCEIGLVAVNSASLTARDSLLSAYKGIRSQYDEKDRETLTGSIKPKKQTK